MYYYKFHIGDYQSHTRHLSPTEHLCYRFLLDLYYLQEKPIALEIEKLSKILMLREYHKEIKSVLDEFFISTENGWINKRADSEIAKYKTQLSIASKAGKKSAKARKEKINKQTGEIK